MGDTQVMGKQSSGHKFRLWLVVLFVAVIVVTVVGLVLYRPSNRLDDDTLRAMVLDHCHAIEGDGDYPDWNITEDIDAILSGVQSFYADNQTYPPFLFGGQAEFKYGGTMAGAKVLPGPNPDPLIAGGYLTEYPKPPPIYGDCKRYSYPTDPRFSSFWMCAYSTPGDWQAMGEWDPETPFHNNKLAGTPENLEGLQIVTLAGTKGREFSYWSKDITNIYGLTGGDDWFKMCCDFRADMLYFGYSRGEWFGADENESWLWFYGNPFWMDIGEPFPQTEVELTEFLERREYDLRELWQKFYGAQMRYKNSGLDIIDLATGDLKPDGNADGIFLLYKLKDGKVVETILAEE